MRDTEEARALKIAARVMQAAGLCRRESPTECRKFYVTEKICESCIRSWLLAKARRS